MKTEWTKTNLSIAGGVIVAALLVLPNLDKGWTILRRITDAVPTAYAAKEQSDAVRSDFDRYLDAERQSQQLEKQRIELQQQFNKQLLNLQQQQHAPNQAMPAPEVWRERTEDGEWYCTDGVEAWWPTESGRCE